jgi:hypothetical protein
VEARLKELAAEPVELTLTIGGDHRLARGEPIEVTQPHRKDAVLGRMGNATAADSGAAVAAAKEAAPKCLPLSVLGVSTSVAVMRSPPPIWVRWRASPRGDATPCAVTDSWPLRAPGR